MILYLLSIKHVKLDWLIFIMLCVFLSVYVVCVYMCTHMGVACHIKKYLFTVIATTPLLKTGKWIGCDGVYWLRMKFGQVLPLKLSITKTGQCEVQYLSFYFEFQIQIIIKHSYVKFKKKTLLIRFYTLRLPFISLFLWPRKNRYCVLFSHTSSIVTPTEHRLIYTVIIAKTTYIIVKNVFFLCHLFFP